jgi:hypothetical protein
MPFAVGSAVAVASLRKHGRVLDVLPGGRSRLSRRDAGRHVRRARRQEPWCDGRLRLSRARASRFAREAGSLIHLTAMRHSLCAPVLVSCALLESLSSFDAPGPIAAAAGAPADNRALAPGSRVWMHAHNCYPVDGAWQDRLTRALGTGLPWVAIEQDLAWIPNAAGTGGKIVVAHDTPARGDEPTLETHFFQRVRPLLERLLAEGDRERWPLMVLSLDFKTNEPEHHRALWDLLGRYERYLTTAVKGSGAGRAATLRVAPLLVLTESGPGQEDAFYTLNGHLPEESLGWSDSYNFGSSAAVRTRWQAVMRAGVDFVAIDQYETFADAWTHRQPAAVQGGPSRETPRPRQPVAYMPSISSR